jgi:DNA-binding NtrC family response regulator
VMDVGLPGMSGIDLLKRFRESEALASVIMLTGDNTAATAATCMRAGAFHYVTKPFRPFELSTVVSSAARHASMRRQLQSKIGPQPNLLIGNSTAIRRMHAAIDRLATQSVSILIQGESGTGKELVARTLHDRGERKTKGRFVALNCGAIPDSLIDSELFGHSKGAFTGATSERAGVFVEADHGTLFLDEIGDMPIGVQARLLRVLQEAEVRPVGGSGVRQIDVRVITATHVDLKAAVDQGRFRQDLFYRLNVVVLTVPPLRERLDDLPLLAAHFLRKHGGATPPSLSPAALEAMSDYAWPGNVRELENALVHAMALHQGETIAVESLPQQIGARLRGGKPASIAMTDDGLGDDLLPLTEAKRRASTGFERRYLLHVMQRSKGSVSEAARLAQLDRTNFRRLLQRHGIDPTSFKA